MFRTPSVHLQETVVYTVMVGTYYAHQCKQRVSKHVEHIKIQIKNINLENVRFVGLYFIIILQYTVQKKNCTGCSA